MLLRLEVFLSKTIKSEVLVFLLMESYRILWTERNWKNENFYYALWPSDVALNINSALSADRSPSFESSKNPQKQFPLRSLYSIRWSQILYRELSEIAHLVGRIKAVEISYTLRIEIFETITMKAERHWNSIDGEFGILQCKIFRKFMHGLPKPNAFAALFWRWTQRATRIMKICFQLIFLIEHEDSN